MRVAEVVDEGAGAVSLRIEGRRLDRLNARAGQFFLWRFLTRDRWWASHPFSLSAAPDGRSLRITIKEPRRLHEPRRARSLPGRASSPRGRSASSPMPFASARRWLLIGGGIGITPIRSLLEGMDGDLVVLYRVDRATTTSSSATSSATSPEARAPRCTCVAGDHRHREGRDLLSPAHLQALVPDIAEREVYVCGPPAMADAIRRSVRKANVPSRYIHTERFAL